MTELVSPFTGGGLDSRGVDRPPRRTVRIGIVGCGPRGLQCLECLSSVAESLAEKASLEITVFEPCDYPGAGCVYDPRQPHYLRMNIASQHIDFWKISPVRPTAQRSSLIGWLSRHYSSWARSDQYVPRAIVGEYLHQCYHEVCRRLASIGTLKRVAEKARDVEPAGEAWRIRSASTDAAYDEVVITTGHEGFRNSRKSSAGEHALPVFPVEKHLSVKQIGVDSNVLIRGFGLTAIDAVLALSEGRGGRFESHANGLRYRPGGLEPQSIHIRSRTGRPMLAKPTALVEPISHAFWRPFEADLRRLRCRHGQLRAREDLWSVITEAAASLLRHEGRSIAQHDVEHWWRGWSRYKMNARSAAWAMAQSYAVATGRRPRDIPYALAEAWRELYPLIVELTGHGGLAAGEWNKYMRVAREMERIACGPSADTVARLLALLRQRAITIGCDQDAAPQCDRTIDAVIAGPCENAVDGPLGKLIRSGRVPTDPLTGAVMVDPSGRVAGAQGQGLAVFGRATEGWIVGNDTLSRPLHPQIQSWARSICIRNTARLR